MTESTEIWSFSRRAVVAVAGSLGGIVWTHGLAQLLRPLGPSDAPLAAGPLTVAAIAVAIVVAALLPRRGAAAGVTVGTMALIAIAVAQPGAWAAALALPLVGVTLGIAGRWLGERLPDAVDSALHRRRLVASVWVALALLGVVQTARLATWVTDPSSNFVLTTSNPFWHGHLCLPAYLYGAELAERGDTNLYDAAHWPALDSGAAPQSRYEGMTVEDPYQYPPQFLLLPWLATEASSSFDTIRIVWFAIQFSLFAAIFAGLALWIGGRAGSLALWSFPAVLAAFPVLHNFQFGQFHLPAVALAVLGMLAFARGRRMAGGLALAVAVLAKLFPAVLLVVLAAQRRFRELAWVGAWALALTIVTWAVFGSAPFIAFADYHLPRLGDGAAFAFDEAWPELGELVVVDNQGVFGLARKFGVDKTGAAFVGRLFGLAVLLLAAFAGRRLGDASRWSRGASWLALIGLASLASPGAWGDYVPVTAVWLLALSVAWVAEDRRRVAPFAVAVALEGLLLGTMPIGDWAPTAIMMPVSALGVVAMLVLFAGVAARPLVGTERIPLTRRSAVG